MRLGGNKGSGRRFCRAEPAAAREYRNPQQEDLTDMMIEANLCHEREAFQPALVDPADLQEQLMELDHTLYELRFYLKRNPEDEMAVLHLKQFERKRRRLAAELAEAKAASSFSRKGEEDLQPA